MTRARSIVTRAFALLAVVLATLLPKLAHAEIAVPAFERYVTDVAGKLTQQERDDLENRLSVYDKETGNQIAVLIVPSLDGEAIEDLAYRTFQKWKLGKKGKDNGVLIVLAMSERRFRIEVGKGLEGDLTDLESSIIIRDKVRPFTKAERWHDGLAAAIAAIEQKLSGKVYGPAPPKAPVEERRAHRNDPMGVFLAIALFVIFFGLILRAFRGGGRGGGGGGPFIFFGGGGFGGGGGGGGGGFGGGGFGGGGGGESGGGGASDDV